VRLYSHTPLVWAEPSVTPVLPSSVYSVASDTVDFGAMVPKPHSQLLKRQVVQALGKLGLLPTTTREPPQFVLPLVFHRPTGWCRRRLTAEEEWMVWDVPWNITKLAVGRHHCQRPERAQIWRQLLPGRCLDSGLRHLLWGFGIMDGGYLMPTTSKQRFGRFQF
jgi:hypothetical protein